MNANLIAVAGALTRRPDWVARMGWMLIDSLWQFALVAGILVLALRVLARASSRVRYAACLMALAAFVLLPSVTWIRVVSPSATEMPATELVATEIPEVPSTPLAVSAGDATQRTSSPTSKTLVLGPNDDLKAEPESARISMASQIALWRRTMEPWLTTLVGAWLTGVALFSLRPLLSGWTVRRLRRVATSPVSERVQALFNTAASKIGLRSGVRVMQSGLLKVPAVVGYFRLIVLVPLAVATSFPPDQLEAVLVHELAHIRRHDYLVNLLQTAIETVFFYHPAIWWVSEQTRREREECCDEIVLSVCRSQTEYAKALISLEELRATSPVTALAASGGSLTSRVRRIVGAESEPRPGLLGILSASAVLAIAALIGFMSPPPEMAIAAALSAPTSAASQPKPNDASGSPGRVMLPDGGFVDFLGVCEYPCRDHAWWRPDGSPLAKAPATLAPDKGNGWFPNSILREFAFDTVAPGEPAYLGVDVPKHDFDTSFSDSVTSENFAGRTLRKHRLVKEFPDKSEAGTITLNYSGGLWTPLRTRGGKPDFTLTVPVEFDRVSSEEEAGHRMQVRVWPTASEQIRRTISLLNQKKLPTHVPAVESIDVRMSGKLSPTDHQFRLVAVDRDNREHPVLMYAVTDFYLFQGTCFSLDMRRFPIRPVCWDIARDQVKEFRFLTRSNPTHRIEFRNISLRPGRKTNFEVWLDGKPYVSQTTDTQSNARPTDVPHATVPTKPPASPTAKTTTEVKANLYRAVLGDGAEFEIVGVSDHPSKGRPWWRADGSPLVQGPSEPFNSRVNDGPPSIHREFVVDARHAAGTTAEAHMEGGGSAAASSSQTKEDGRRRDRFRFAMAFPNTVRTASAVIAYASGPWNTVAQCLNPDGSGVAIGTQSGGVVFGEPVEAKGELQISVSYDLKEPGDVRVVAVDEEGHEHSAVRQSMLSAQNANLMTARFGKLTLSKIKEFRFQRRRSRRIEFRQIALHPGQNAPVEIWIDDKPYVPTMQHNSGPESANRPVATPTADQPAARPSASPTRQDAPVVEPATAPASVTKGDTSTPLTEIQRNPFRAVFPDGSTIAFLHLGSGPAEQDQWWRPNGSMVKVSPSDRTGPEGWNFPDRNLTLRRLELDAVTKPTAGFLVTVNGYSRDSKPSRAVVRGTAYEEHRLLIGVAEKSTTTISARYYPKPWRTVGTWNVRPGEQTANEVTFPEGKAVFAEPTRKNGGTQIVIAYEVQDQDARVVAVDQRNTEHQPEVLDGDGGRKMWADFQRLSAAQIRGFRFQIRDYRRLEFRNVSLQPGRETNVEIFIDGKRYVPKATEPTTLGHGAVEGLK